MWELPEVTAGDGDKAMWLRVRHSITVTDYTVRVARGPAPDSSDGQWVAKSRLGAVPLTGLTRKILRAAKVI